MGYYASIKKDGYINSWKSRNKGKIILECKIILRLRIRVGSIILWLVQWLGVCIKIPQATWHTKKESGGIESELEVRASNWEHRVTRGKKESGPFLTLHIHIFLELANEDLLFIQLIFTERLADSKSISQGNGGYSNEQDRFTVPTLTVLRFWWKNKIKESYKLSLIEN